MSQGGGSQGTRRRKSSSASAARGTMGTGKTAGSSKVEGAMGKHQRTGDGMGKSST